MPVVLSAYWTSMGVLGQIIWVEIVFMVYGLVQLAWCSFSDRVSQRWENKQTRQESSPIHKQTHYKWCVSSSLNIVCACCHLICCVTAKVVCVCVLILVCWLNKCDLLWESGVAPVMRLSLARSCTRVSRPPHDPLQSLSLTSIFLHINL